MKTQKLSRAINSAKSWPARLALAEDRIVGTRFDFIFSEVTGALRSIRLSPLENPKTYYQNGQFSLGSMAKDALAAFGTMCAEQIETLNSAYFREMADALDAGKKHKPDPERIRLEIIKFCIPPTGKFTTDDIRKHLVQASVLTELQSLDDGIRSKIQNTCKALKIKLSKGKSGPKNPGKKRGKKFH